MSWIEEVLILAGVLLDVFAATEGQGAMVAKVNKKQLTGICFLMAGCQLAALLGGYALARLCYRLTAHPAEQLIGGIIACAIFLLLGIRLMAKAMHRDTVLERLTQKLPMGYFVRLSGQTAVFMVLAGISFGFLQTNLWALIGMILILSVVVIIGGMYAGYHFGLEQRRAAYVIGAVLLLLAAADVVIRCVIFR